MVSFSFSAGTELKLKGVAPKAGVEVGAPGVGVTENGLGLGASGAGLAALEDPPKLKGVGVGADEFEAGGTPKRFELGVGLASPKPGKFPNNGFGAETVVSVALLVSVTPKAEAVVDPATVLEVGGTVVDGADADPVSGFFSPNPLNENVGAGRAAGVSFGG